MNASLHPIMADALRGFIRPQRIDGPWEYCSDSGEITAPKCGFIPDDVPLAVVTDLGGAEVGNGYRMAAANEMHAALMLFMEAGVGNSTDYRKQAQAHAAATRALAKADGIV